MPDLHVYIPNQLHERIKQVAADLEARGFDVKPENPKAKIEYSLAKIVDYLLTKDGK